MRILLLTLLLAAAASWLRVPPLGMLGLSGLGLALSAALVGSAIEALAGHLGPRAGRLLDALFGSAAELIIAAFALKAGMRELVKASITGSILANLLLILGLGALLGGLRHGRQFFDRERAGHAATLMVLSVIALSVPAIYGQLSPVRNSGPTETLSEAVAAVMLLVFLLSIYYDLFWLEAPLEPAAEPPDARRWPLPLAIGLLLAALVTMALLAARFVAAVPGVGAEHGLGPSFIGVLLIPLVANLAEHHATLRAAWRNRMDIALDISTGASRQVALFVAPLLVFLSLLIGTPMDLVLAPLQLAALAAAAAVAALVAQDGRTTWLEGVMLFAVYALMVLGFFWWPA